MTSRLTANLPDDLANRITNAVMGSARIREVFERELKPYGLGFSNVNIPNWSVAIPLPRVTEVDYSEIVKAALTGVQGKA